MLILAGITAASLGTFMMGVGAVAAVLTPALVAVWRRLGHVNHAVNGVAKGEPTLREVTVGTADVVVALAEKLGQLTEKVDGMAEVQEKHGKQLDAHTIQDHESFGTLREGQEDMVARMKSLVAPAEPAKGTEADPVHVEVHSAP